MSPFRADFNLDPDVIWFNAASEGPLPNVAAKALQEAVFWKSSPHRLTIPKFISVPHYLKQAIAALINAPIEEIILGNSATYGMQLLAQGLPLQPGDEVLTMKNDFPTDILPWLTQGERGIHVKQIAPIDCVLSVDELQKAITAKTRVVCLPHVHTFSGHRLDIPVMGALCREHNITFIVNITQSVGNEPIDLSLWMADAVVAAGYKWLCGPYGTGFAWISSDLMPRLTVKQAYWPAVLSEEQLGKSDVISPQDVKTMHLYDQYGTANFFNYVPWKAAIDYLTQVGIGRIQEYNQGLITAFMDGLDRDRYGLISPEILPERTNSVIFTHRDKERNPTIFETLKKQGVYLGFWKGNMRFSPHLYNTAAEVDQMIELLHKI